MSPFFRQRTIKMHTKMAVLNVMVLSVLLYGCESWALTRAHLQDQVMAIHARLGTTVMMITHDVDEAVLLSDRIVMMTNGPNATIGEVLDVDLPRPRDRLALASDARFLAAREAVLRFLHERHALPAAA